MIIQMDGSLANQLMLFGNPALLVFGKLAKKQKQPDTASSPATSN